MKAFLRLFLRHGITFGPLAGSGLTSAPAKRLRNRQPFREAPLSPDNEGLPHEGTDTADPAPEERAVWRKPGVAAGYSPVLPPDSRQDAAGSRRPPQSPQLFFRLPSALGLNCELPEIANRGGLCAPCLFAGGKKATEIPLVQSLHYRAVTIRMSSDTEEARRAIGRTTL